MKDRILARRRALRLIALTALAAPIATIAGCAQAPNDGARQRRRSGGGNRGSEKSGGGLGGNR